MNQARQQASGTMQTRGQGGAMQRRGSYTPSLFALSPREMFSASPFELMRRFSEEMDRAFENFGLAQSGGRGFGGETMMWAPAVEVFERDDKLIVRAELPGLNQDDVRVEMTDDGLVIQGERQREHEEEGQGWHRSERSYGQFYRLIPLPENMDAEQAQAQFNNGVLEITLPMPEAQSRRRSIPIGGQSQGGQQTSQSQTASGGAQKK